MLRMSALIVAAIISVFATPTKAYQESLSNLSIDQIIRQFDSVVFGREHGAGPAASISRWEDAPSIGLFISPSFTGKLPTDLIRQQLAEISELTGLDITATDRPQEASLRLGFFPRDSFSNLQAAPDSDVKENRRFVTTSACLGIVKTGEQAQVGEILFGLVMIGTDIPVSLQMHCLLEELVQIMGLPSDACHYQPSLFCEQDFVSEMTPADKILLKALYDPRIETGMPRKTALQVARAVILDLLAADDP